MEFDRTEVKYTFSGHDSFHCRQLWLKKGYDFIVSNNSFTDEDAVVKLGVGKNMVSSIRFWLRAFGISDIKDQPTQFGHALFNDEDGYDPYLEDEASLWLLHYFLVKTRNASTYSLMFNDFRKEKPVFTKTNYVDYVKRKLEGKVSIALNENTLSKDISVFLNLYKSNQLNNEIEEGFSGILADLDLIHELTQKKEEGDKKAEQYVIENSDRDTLPAEVVLFTILDNKDYGNSISFSALEADLDSPGSIFCLSRKGLIEKIDQIVSRNSDIVYSDQAGIRELQFKSKMSSFYYLDKYYGKSI